MSQDARLPFTPPEQRKLRFYAVHGHGCARRPVAGPRFHSARECRLGNTLDVTWLSISRKTHLSKLTLSLNTTRQAAGPRRWSPHPPPQKKPLGQRHTQTSGCTGNPDLRRAKGQTSGSRACPLTGPGRTATARDRVTARSASRSCSRSASPSRNLSPNRSRPAPACPKHRPAHPPCSPEA